MKEQKFVAGITTVSINVIVEVVRNSIVMTASIQKKSKTSLVKKEGRFPLLVALNVRMNSIAK